jgi:hypothetical protein
MSESVVMSEDAPATSDTPLDSAPVATEAPAPDSTAPATADQPDAPPSEGTPRDEHGRFAKRDGEQPPAAQGTPPAPVPGQPPQTLPTSAPPAPQPFAFRSNGQRVPLEGATYEPGKGLLIPDGPALQHARQLMARGHEYHTVGHAREQQYRQTIQQLQQAAESRTQQDDAELAVYRNWFLEILNDPSGDTLIERAQNFNLLAPALKEQARAAKLEKEIEAMRAQTQRPQVSPEQETQQLVQSVYRVAGDFLEELKEDGQYAALTPADWKDLTDMIRKRPGALVEDVNGETLLNTEPIRDQAERFKRIRTEAAEQTRATAKATQYNAQRAAPAAPPTKPAPVARATVPAEPETEEAKYRRQKEWEQWVTTR